MNLPYLRIAASALSFAIIGSFAIPTSPLAEVITCPPTIQVEQKARLADPAPQAKQKDPALLDHNWTVIYLDRKPVLEEITIFDGPPAQMAALVPDEEKTVQDKVIQTWKLAKNARGYWLQCEYAGTVAALYRRLPESIARCQVMYNQDQMLPGNSLVIERVGCDAGK